MTHQHQQLGTHSQLSLGLLTVRGEGGEAGDSGDSGEDGDSCDGVEQGLSLRESVAQ